MHRPDGTEFVKTNAWKEEIIYVQINVRFGISSPSGRIGRYFCHFGIIVIDFCGEYRNTEYIS